MLSCKPFANGKTNALICSGNESNLNGPVFGGHVELEEKYAKSCDIMGDLWQMAGYIQSSLRPPLYEAD